MAGSTNHKRRYILREVQDGRRGMDDHKEPLDLEPRERDFLNSKITNKNEEVEVYHGDENHSDHEKPKDDPGRKDHKD